VKDLKVVLEDNEHRTSESARALRVVLDRLPLEGHTTCISFNNREVNS
jgi:hypothetical protein